MADNVDISLKLGTEADLSSAISAGARAGAAFAAAAQSAVNSITFGTSASLRAFTTSSRQISSGADLTHAIRSAGVQSGVISAIFSRTATGGSGGFLPPPKLPFAGTSAMLPPPGGGGVGFTSWDPRFRGGATNAPVPVDIGKAANENINKVAVFAAATNRVITGEIVRIRRGGSGGSGGGGGIFDADYSEEGNGRWGKYFKKSSLFKALGYGKMAQGFVAPYIQYLTETAIAEYQGETARSTAGFRQEMLNKYIAENKAMATYSRKTGAWGGLGLGLLLAPFTAGLSIPIGAIAGGVGGEIYAGHLERDAAEEQEKLKRQYKNLEESQRRYYANTLFGGYNTSFAKAVAGLGLGATEESQMANSTTALTFLGDLVRGRVSESTLQSLAFMPNTFSNYVNGVTDPAQLQSGYLADLGGLNDSLAASLAKDTIGLGTWATIKSGAYGRVTDRFNMATLASMNDRYDSAIGGYINALSQNVVNDQVTDLAGFIKAANVAPNSFWGGQGRPSESETGWAEQIFNFAKSLTNFQPTAPIILNVIVDGETVKSETIDQRDEMLKNGQSFIVGGV